MELLPYRSRLLASPCSRAVGSSPVFGYSSAHLPYESAGVADFVIGS